MTSGIFLSSATIQSLAPSLREAIFEAAGLADIPTNRVGSDYSNVPEELAELSDRQIRKLLANIHPKTHSFLAVIADLPPRFLTNDLSDRLGIARDKWRLSGVLSGLTKRVRTVTGDPDTLFIVWSDPDENGLHKYAEIHPATHQSLRRALGK